MTVCPRCGKPSVDAEWVNEVCRWQSEDMRAAIFAASLCVPETLIYFGLDVGHPKPPPVPVPLRPYDGTRDEVGRY